MERDSSFQLLPHSQHGDASMDTLNIAEKPHVVNPERIPLDYTGPAIWTCSDADIPVIITGHMGRKDGKDYFSTTGGAGGLPGDELRIEQPETDDYTFSKESCLHLADVATNEAQRQRWLDRAALVTEATPTDPTEERTRQLLNLLHQGGSKACYWEDPGRRSTWFDAGDCPDPPETKRNLFFGVHPTRAIPETNSKGEKKSPRFVRSQNQYIEAVNCLFGEWDAKDFIDDLSPLEITNRAALIRAGEPGLSEDEATEHAEKELRKAKCQHYLERYKQKALDHVLALDILPSVVVDSGGGYQGYWFLRDTFSIVTEGDRIRIDTLQKAWVAKVGSDPAANDLVRVLRVPGSTNYKPHYGPDFPKVKIVLWQPERLYTLEDLESTTPDKAQPRTQPRTSYNLPESNDTIERARATLERLDPARADKYHEWLKVGFSLCELGQPGLELWQTWSAQSTKYHDPGNDKLMRDKWGTFTPGVSYKDITLGSLFYWADQDSPRPQEINHVLQARRTPRAPDELPARCSMCGTILRFPDPNAMNKLKQCRIVCGDYRNCEFCAKTKGAGLRKRIIAAMQSGAVFVTRTNVHLGRRLVRRLGKENILRIPVGEDDIVIFNTAEGTEVTDDNLPTVRDLAEFVRAAAEGKRITGTLGQSEEADDTLDISEKDQADDSEKETVLVKMISHDCDDKRLEKAIYEAAWERTKDKVLAHTLTTAVDVEIALDLIVTEFKKLLRMSGFIVDYQVGRHVTCDLRRISLWRDSYVLNDISDTETPPGGKNGAPGP